MSTDNSNTPPETLDAILAEMRTYADRLDDAGVWPSPTDLRTLADRIEAAAEREREETRQLAAIAESDESFARCARCDRPERDSAPGNAAAIREALDKAESVLLVGARFATDNAFTDADARENLRDVDWDGALAKIAAALAAPARNCDRFENWMQAWDGYLAKYPDARQEMPFEIGRFHAWLFAPAKGGDAGEEAR